MAFALSVHRLFCGALVQTTPEAANSFRLIAATVLVMVLCGLIYALRNLRSLKAETGSSTSGGGRRTNHIMIFVACVVVFAIACFLLFRMATA